MVENTNRHFGKQHYRKKINKPFQNVFSYYLETCNLILIYNSGKYSLFRSIK